VAAALDLAIEIAWRDDAERSGDLFVGKGIPVTSLLPQYHYCLKCTDYCAYITLSTDIAIGTHVEECNLGVWCEP
jgi:hypothetical protein